MGRNFYHVRIQLQNEFVEQIFATKDNVFAGLTREGYCITWGENLKDGVYAQPNFEALANNKIQSIVTVDQMFIAVTAKGKCLAWPLKRHILDRKTQETLRNETMA